MLFQPLSHAAKVCVIKPRSQVQIWICLGGQFLSYIGRRTIYIAIFAVIRDSLSDP